MLYKKSGLHAREVAEGRDHTFSARAQISNTWTSGPSLKTSHNAWARANSITYIKTQFDLAWCAYSLDFYTQKKVVIERWPKEWSRKF